MKVIVPSSIKAIVGLGNPGSRYADTRHNIGFKVVEALASKYGGTWRTKDNAETAEIMIADKPILLVKPLTSMNLSGNVLPALQKNGITICDILFVHDELEKPFGALSFKVGGSHRGHNGLRSLIQAMGPDFGRIRCGIGRPENKEEVPDYVLTRFAKHEPVEPLIAQAVELVKACI